MKEQLTVTNAHKMRGNRFLIVGENDDNFPLESTCRVVDELIKANKNFDLLLVPGIGTEKEASMAKKRRGISLLSMLLMWILPPVKSMNYYPYQSG